MPVQCTIPNCSNPACVRGWCNKHYLRWRRWGNPNRLCPTLTERFWAKVRIGPVPVHRPVLGFCWEWTAAKCPLGYGRFGLGRKADGIILAHRWAYESLIGPIPEGLEPDHLCRNPSCVNPSHLEPVTHKENIRRGIRVGNGGGKANRAKTHCPYGHPYDEANTCRRPNGTRLCRACARLRYHQRKNQRKNH